MSDDVAAYDFDYRTQAVRDLAWSLASPSLMDHPDAVGEARGRQEIARNRGLLSRLDGDDTTLRDAIRRRSSGRLGEYFETLLRVWIDEIPPATLLGANIQAHERGGTAGEFDMVFRRDRAIHHWELAIKFYLGHPGPAEKPRWSGPNPRDRLDRKWKKMLNHQLRLSRHPAGRRALEKLGIGSEEVLPSLFLKGYLFEALDPEWGAEHHPDANPNGLRGWWVHRDRLEHFRPELDPSGELRWLRLSRLRWISPARVTERDRVHSFAELTERLRGDRPSLVAGLTETDEGLRETTRGFVVPSGWPNR